MDISKISDWPAWLMTAGFFLLVFYLATVIVYNAGMTVDWLLHWRRK